MRSVPAPGSRGTHSWCAPSWLLATVVTTDLPYRGCGLARACQMTTTSTSRALLWTGAGLSTFLAALAGFFVGAGPVAGNFVPGTAVGGALTAISSGARLAKAQAFTRPDPIPGRTPDARLGSTGSTGSTMAHHPSVPPRSRSEEAATTARRQPSQTPTPEASAFSLTSQSLDARDWLFIAGMSVHHHPPGTPAR